MNEPVASYYISDHIFVVCQLNTQKAATVIETLTCRKNKQIDIEKFKQACISSVWASAMELLAKWNKVMWWNLNIYAKPKDSIFFLKFVKDSTLAIWFEELL